jgi:hypothetical protein
VTEIVTNTKFVRFLSDPDVIAAEIVEDLQAALDQFAQIAAALGDTE